MACLCLLRLEVFGKAGGVGGKEGVVEGDLELPVVDVLVLRGEQAVLAQELLHRVWWDSRYWNLSPLVLDPDVCTVLKEKSGHHNRPFLCGIMQRYHSIDVASVDDRFDLLTELFVCVA